MYNNTEPICLLTFDVEEWFQVENLKSAIRAEEWDRFPSSVLENTQLILRILDKYDVKATFFVLGWVGEKCPELLHEIYHHGHEVACHGYGHELTNRLDDNQLREDISKAKEVLESTIAHQIVGYRSPSFSIHPKLFPFLIELGFRYDSSYNPFSLNKRYGKIDAPLRRVSNGCYQMGNGLFEFPISTLKIKNNHFPIGGGAYFRIIPLFLMKLFVNWRLKQEGLYNIYLHPWEFQGDQPRIKKIPLSYQFRHYYGLERTPKKFEKFVQYLKKLNCHFMTMEKYLEEIVIHK